MYNQFQQPMGYYPNMFMNQGVVPSAQPLPKTGNWLTAEKYAALQNSQGQFKLSVSPEELAKGQCNHYKLDGSSAIVFDNDGSGGCTCTICGTHFNTKEFGAGEVENATQNILDILNAIKLMYLSIDPNAALEFFQIIPFIEKIPKLYNIAAEDFKKYEGVNQFNPAGNANPFDVYHMMSFGPVMPMPGYPQQPMAYPQQPVANMGYPQAQPGFNPMYGAPQQPVAPGYQPQPGYAFNPQGAAAPMVNTNMPVQPQAPAAPAEAPVKVDTEFKK